MLWKNTYRKMSPSCPYQRVAVLATTMLWASIILPITPPELLAAAIRTGLKPSCIAVVFCSPPQATGNPYFLKTLDFLTQYLAASMIRTNEFTRQLHEEHSVIVEAIRRRDAARDAAATHMFNAARRLGTVEFKSA